MKKLLSNPVWKPVLMVIFSLSAAAAFLFIGLTADMWEPLGIRKGFEEYEYVQLGEQIMPELEAICKSYRNGGPLSDDTGKESNVYFMVSQLRETSTVHLSGTLPEGVFVDDCYVYVYVADDEPDSSYRVRAMVLKTFPYQDRYSELHEELLHRYQMKNRFFLCSVIFSAAACISFILLCLCAGKKRNPESAGSRISDKIPYDVVAAAAVILNIYLWKLTDLFQFAGSDAGTAVFEGRKASLMILFLTCAVCIGIVYSGIKNRKGFRNLLVVKIGSIILRGGGVMPEAAGRILCIVLYAAAQITALFIALEKRHYAVWIAVQLIIGGMLIYHLLMLSRIRKAAERKETDGRRTRIGTAGMGGDLKLIADYLNSLDEEIRLAVQEQIKSERMKVELITNVSHDLKTPLTSIINYVDLLSRENASPEEKAEYLEILQSYSKRLKFLVEDLLEASKITTGNVEVDFVECNIGIMLSQAVGEFEDRAAEKHIEIVLEKPERPVVIMADSQYLFRVLENLMSNICKYSLEHSRAYLTLTAEGGTAYISFKNISKAALNISPDELTERFVRGDKARNTEGSGLGLSIAKSLTELQGGTISLEIEGDMFKVLLCFPESANAEGNPEDLRNPEKNEE